VAAYIVGPCWCMCVALSAVDCQGIPRLRLLPNIATYTHQQGPTNICSHITTVLTTHQYILIDYFNNCNSVTLATTNNTLPADGVTAMKHVGAF
jgi:hypothetical protein